MKRAARKSAASTAKDRDVSGKDAKPKEKPSQKPLQALPMGFYALPLLRKGLLGPHDTYVKHLFVKVRQEEERVTLIVSNISVDDTEESLRGLVETLTGLTVSNVEIGKDRLAVVRLEGVAQFEERFLKAITREQCLAIKTLPGQSEKKCSERWLTEYRQQRPDRASLGREADEKMAEIEQKEREIEEALKQPQVDEDGFIMVVPKNKKVVLKPKQSEPASTSSATPATAVDDLDRHKKKKAKKRLMDENLSFYRFERKRLRQEENSKLKVQIKTDLRKAERIKMELSKEGA